MLPAYRTEGQEDTLPPFALARSDVEGFLHELRGFHEASATASRAVNLVSISFAIWLGSSARSSANR
jgi:hypothetical protein